MLRYVAPSLFAVITIFAPTFVNASSTGNIGCLFSQLLCNPEKEWCYNDFAFGKCLPLYGNVREEDLQRFNFGASELHVLEREMQRLFLLGYRWSHTYTQCVLQAVLVSIKNKSDLDISRCNAELDQDLEGALKAIEGEEMEHIDPKNLAIVRFTPSVANPHSDYADEFYYPPMEEMLPPYKGKGSSKDSDKNSKEQGGKEKLPKEDQHEGDAQDKESNDLMQEDEPKTNKIQKPPPQKPQPPSSLPIPVVKEDDGDEYDLPPPTTIFRDDDEDEFLPYLEIEEIPDEEFEEVGVRPMTQEEIIAERMALPPPAMPMSLYLENLEKGIPPDVSEKDYDYDLLFRSPYASPPKFSRMFKRSHGDGTYDVTREKPDDLSGNIFSKSSFKPRNLRELARMLSSLRPPERGIGNKPLVDYSSSSSTGNMYYAPAVAETERSFDGRRRPTGDIGFFQEGPVMLPSFHERSRAEESVYFPRYENAYTYPPAQSQIPELELPETVEEEDKFPETLHPPHMKSDYDKPDDIKSFDNSASRFDKDSNPIFEGYGNNQDNRNQYQWMLADESPNDNSYSSYKDSVNDYKNPYSNIHVPVPITHRLPSDAYYSRPVYPLYNYGAYDYRTYPDYPDYIVNDYHLGGPNPWGSANLHRDERLDVKKPGPFFKSDNDFAFDYPDSERSPDYFPGENDWIAKMDPVEGEAFLLAKLRQGQGLNRDGSKPSNAGGEKELQQGQVPDLLLTEEGYVEAASDESRRRKQEGFPKAAHQVASKETIVAGAENHKEKEPDSYVYISISGSFQSTREAEQLVHLIIHLSGLNINQIQNLSVQKNQVIFQLKDNAKGMTAAQLAERTEELRDTIKEKTGMEITQSGVGTKSAISAVVYSSGDRQMLAAAAIVCGVCAALLVAATTLFFLRRHSRSKAKLQGITAQDTEASKDYQDLCRARMSGKGDGKDALSGGPGHAHPVGSTGHAPGQRISSLSKESDNGNNSPSSRSSTSSWSEEPVMSNMDISTGHMVLSYMEDHLRNKDRLEQEWVALCAYEAEPCATNIAMKPENAQKNRYQDVLPYDHNRVILNEHTNVSGSSYINASSITDHDPRNPAYIATQGPLASTAADFWQLVWEQGSVVIVMLTRLTENGQSLCHRYWPEEGSELYHIYEVHLVSEHIWCDDYLVRSFYLKNVRTGETRTVTQFHFLSWPESGIPASTKALLEFRRKVNKSYRGRSCPIIVHCSDGVGRSGTYCLIDMVLNRMSKGAKEIDIAATLEHIRDQRPNMVKTKAQFEFVLMSVAEEVHAILKALPQ